VASILTSIWQTVTRLSGQGIGRFLIGIGLVSAVIFAFVALAILS